MKPRTARDRRDARKRETTTALLRRYVATTPTMARRLLRPALPGYSRRVASAMGSLGREAVTA